MIFDFNTKAKDVFFNNSNNSLSSINVQDAINETYDTTKIIATATGEHITVDKSADASVREFKVDGRTEQVTTTGKNLLNSSLFEDNKYQNPGGNATTHADYWITGKQKILPNTTYTRSTGSYGTYFDSNGNVISSPYLTNETTFTTPSNAYFVSFCIAKKSQLAFGGEIQLEEGNKSTEYELYTGGVPSPNPDYPQDIKGVGNNGEVEVTVTGKNLFTTVNSSMVSDTYNTAPTIKENSITGGWAYKLNGFNKSHAGCIFSVKLRHPDTTTTSRATFTFQAENNADVMAYHFNNEFVNNRLYSMVVPENATKVKIDYGKLSPTAELYDFQIEHGEVATEYEPYKAQIVKIPVEPLIDPSPLYEGDYAVLKDGTIEITKKNVVKIYNGSEEWNYGGTNGTERFGLAFDDGNVICKKVTCDTYLKSPLTAKYGISFYEDGYIDVMNKDITSLTEWKAYLAENPITVVYELAEPSKETTVTDIDFSTYNHVTNITNADNANMEVEYFTNSANGNAVLEMQKELQKEIAELDNKKANKTDIPVLKGYVEKGIGDMNTYNVPAHTTVKHDCLVSRAGYKPVFANVYVSNTSNNETVICTQCNIDTSEGRVYFQLMNLSDSLTSADVIVEVLYVKDI